MLDSVFAGIIFSRKSSILSSHQLKFPSDSLVPDFSTAVEKLWDFCAFATLLLPVIGFSAYEPLGISQTNFSRLCYRREL